MTGKTLLAFPAHAQPAILRIWQEVHGINNGSGNGLVPDGTKPLPDVESSTMGSCNIHPRVISQEVLKIYVAIIHTRYTLSTLWANNSGLGVVWCYSWWNLDKKTNKMIDFGQIWGQKDRLHASRCCSETDLIKLVNLTWHHPNVKHKPYFVAMEYIRFNKANT